MQNCENVVQEWEVDINSSLLNYIFTIHDNAQSGNE